MSAKDEQSLQEMMAAFDEVVAWFEQDEFDVEEAIKKYEQGHALAEKIREKLNVIENKVTVLKQSFDGE